MDLLFTYSLYYILSLCGQAHVCLHLVNYGDSLITQSYSEKKTSSTRTPDDSDLPASPFILPRPLPPQSLPATASHLNIAENEPCSLKCISNSNTFPMAVSWHEVRVSPPSSSGECRAREECIVSVCRKTCRSRLCRRRMDLSNLSSE